MREAVRATNPSQKGRREERIGVAECVPFTVCRVQSRFLLMMSQSGPAHSRRPSSVGVHGCYFQLFHFISPFINGLLSSIIIMKPLEASALYEALRSKADVIYSRCYVDYHGSVVVSVGLQLNPTLLRLSLSFATTLENLVPRLLRKHSR
jgi:hypothetical protein